MTNEVQQTRWDRIIRRVSGSIGPGSRVSETLSELFPVLDVENVPGELLLLGGTQLCIGQTIESANAGDTPSSSLRNPGESGTLITVTSIRIFSGTAQAGRGGPSLNTLPNTGTQAVRDTRVGPTGQPVGIMLSDNSLSLAPLFYRFELNGTDDLVIEDPNGVAVITQGTSFIVGASIANTDLRVGWLWRERPAEQSELSL